MTPDGRWVVYPQQNPGMLADIMLVPFDGSAPPKPIVQAPQGETSPWVSPDGKWLAFARMGQWFVQSFPDGRGLRQISREGGLEPRWRRDGKELYFINKNQLLAVDLAVTGAIAPGVPHVLFTRPMGLHDYDATADGEQFLLVSPDVAAERGTLSVVMNWARLLAACAKSFRGPQT